MQYLILGYGERGCWLALLGRLQQVALFGGFCLTPVIISVHMCMLIYDHFFNWIFMETLNKVASLKKQVHMSFLLRNSNNCHILQHILDVFHVRLLIKKKKKTYGTNL